jgi:CBS domain-containing protein
MSPRTVTDPLLRDAPLLHETDSVADGVRALVAADLPALPVLDGRDRLAGIFGEREFLGAIFPGYLGQLKYAGFVKRGLEDALEKHGECRHDPVGRYMNTEHVDVGTDFSDVQVAEIFLHHRVLLVPVADDGRVTGVITRSDFFRSLAERFLGG